jgi:hypothetical protein
VRKIRIPQEIFELLLIQPLILNHYWYNSAIGRYLVWKSQNFYSYGVLVSSMKSQKPFLTISPSPQTVISSQRRIEISRILRDYCVKVAADRRDAIKKAAVMAAYCIEDSFQGRLSNGLASNSKKSSFMLSIFRLQTSEWLLNLILLASGFHTVCVFYESSGTLPGWVWSLNTLIVVFVYSCDVGMKMTYQGVDEYFSHDWHKVYVLSISTMLMETMLTGSIHYANFLRPAPGVLRSRSGRKFFSIIKKMCSQLSQTFIPMVSCLSRLLLAAMPVSMSRCA